MLSNNYGNAEKEGEDDVFAVCVMMGEACLREDHNNKFSNFAGVMSRPVASFTAPEARIPAPEPGVTEPETGARVRGGQARGVSPSTVP